MIVRTNDDNLSNDHLTPERQTALAWMAAHEEIFGKPRTEAEVMKELREDPEAYQKYQTWSELFQQEFLGFCMGVQGMGATYDPVFKKICNPETHPERLTEFLSLCLGQALEIMQVLPNESNRLTEDGSLLVMDILIKLDTGALINVEIQRIGYLFPGARCACYSSDLVMRQYTQVRSQKKAEGKHAGISRFAGPIPALFQAGVQHRAAGGFAPRVSPNTT